MTEYDQSVADTTPPAGGVFGDPNGGLPEAVKSFTIDQVLEMAKTPEKRARVCLRGDLQAAYDERIAELATLVDAEGNLIADADAAVGDTSPEQRARELEDEAQDLRRQMADAMWLPLFRGLTSDDLALFNAAHSPKGDNPDMTEYNTQLIAATAVEPVLSVDQVRALRKKLGSRAMGELVGTANWVCSRGGVDIPKSSPFSRNRPGR